MVSIKIQCVCGQRYAFEVEPVGGRLPAAVTCPSCGADGTAAANAAIAQTLVPPPPAPDLSALPPPAAAPAQPVPVAAPAPAARTGPRRGSAPLPFQVDRTQAQFEARAKISWGDPPREVLFYLMGQGFTAQEASEFVDQLCRERAATIRVNGIKYILGGAALIFVPIVAFFIFMNLGYILIKTFLTTIVIGLVGIWLAIKGGSMVLSPHSEQGDVAEQ